MPQTTLRDIDLMERALHGEEAAIQQLQSRHTPLLRATLASHGASREDMDDLLSSLWAEGLAGKPDKEPLFHRYDGRSPLQPWLTAIIVNRWISLKRRHSAHQKMVDRVQEREPCPAMDNDGLLTDKNLRHFMAQAIRQSFATCNPETRVILYLVHMHRVPQKEIARMWGCHPSKISRMMTAAEKHIAETILQAIQDFDPLLKIDWSDFLLLCESTRILQNSHGE